MATYLLTWNPRQSLEAGLKRVVAKLGSGNVTAEARWSCGNNKNIFPGDRVFLLRQGVDSPGMVGSGWITRGSHRDRKWNKKNRRQFALYVRVEWDAMLSPEGCLPRADLLHGILPRPIVNIASSGVQIDEPFAHRLERAWAAHRKTAPMVAPNVIGRLSALEGEPIEYRAYRRKRDQKLKRAALDFAKGVCAACDVDFSMLLDGKGLRVLQVHHKRQLAQEHAPRINTLADLAVLCANCHALVHMNAGKALTVQALRSMLKSHVGKSASL